MKFEEAADLLLPHGAIAAIADGGKGIAQPFAVLVGAAIGIVEVEGAGIDPGGDHGRGKARALFIGPVDHHDRRFGLVADIIQGADQFQTGQHAQNAVELAAGRLGIEVRAAGHGGQAIVPTRSHGEDVAHFVDGD